jgi:hypothetical protein
MKIAVLGYHQEALSCAHELLSLGAEVVLFAHNRQVEIDYNSELKIFAGEIKRVQKRFLMKHQDLGARSRLADLFRVVYEFKPQIDFSDDQSFWEKFKSQEKDHAHLLKASERFIDVDLVIDMLNDEDFPKTMGSAGTHALGEQYLQENNCVFYGKQSTAGFLKGLEEFSAHQSPQTIALVGTHQDSLEVLLQLSHSNRYHIVVISTEKEPWSQVADLELKKMYQNHLSKLLKEYESEKAGFQNKMNEWKSLEDYIQLKYPKPVEPSFPIRFYTESQVTAIDALSDQKGLYLTVENFDFNLMKGEHQTISVGSVFVATGYQKDYSYLRSLQIKEPALISSEAGYYFLTNTLELPLILKDIERFFTHNEA